MKRFMFSLAVWTLTFGLAAASGGAKGGGKAGSGSTSGGGSVSKGIGSSKATQIVDKKVGDVGKNLDVKKFGDLGKGLGDKKFDGVKTPTDKFGKGGKFDLHGNAKVAKLPGFKSNPKLHTLYCGKFNIPNYLHSHCFFHFDFCWNHCCWLPNWNCCGYWHPYARCWYYWYEPWCCYLPYSYIESYRPVVVVEQAPVVVNVNNTNTSSTNDVDPLAVTPSLPAGASATLPANVNPIIPAPKE